MRFLGPKRRGRFLCRENRFLVRVVLDSGQVQPCYLPNSGRLEGVLRPGIGVLVRESNRTGKTRLDLLAVYTEGGLVSVDARIPNGLIQEALENRELEEYADYEELLIEYRRGNIKLDFCLRGREATTLIEVKSCTLVKEGMALFPDAPTLRGRRHLAGLMEALGQGFKAALIFVIQRGDASSFSPNHLVDPLFAHLLRRAMGQGLQVGAYTCLVTEEEIRLDRRVPFRLMTG